MGDNAFILAYTAALKRLDAALEELNAQRARFAQELEACLQRKASKAKARTGKIAAGLVLGFSLTASANQPNILVVLSDDQDVGMLSEMPQVQALWGDQGVKFTRAFASTPLCAASRATLITGQYAHNHGVWANTPGYGGMDYEGTLPVWLQAAGYKTGFLGKFLNDYGNVNAPGKTGPPCDEVPPGWNTWFAFLVAPHYNNYLTSTNGQVVKYGTPSVPPGCTVDSSVANMYSTDKLSQRASAWVTSHAGSGPWFLLVAPYASHADAGPPTPAARHSGLFASDPFPIPGSLNYNEANVSDKPAVIQAFPLLDAGDTAQRAQFHRKRRESMLAVDELIAAAESAIVSSGQDANTVRIFASDNGWLNGEHRVPGNKSFVYEESSRIPLVVRGPGYPAGQVREELVGNADMTATIVTLAGATPTRVLDGADLGPLLRNDPVTWRVTLLIESRVAGLYDAIRNEEYTYAEHLSGEAELYHMTFDEGQLESKHSDPTYASLQAVLSAQLQTLRTCAGASCWQ